MIAYEEILTFDKNVPFKIILSDKPTYLGAHWHNAIEFMYFYDISDCEYSVKENKYSVNSGDLITVNPFQVHQCNDFGKASVCCIIMDTEFLGNYKGVVFCNHIKGDVKISEIFNKIKQSQNNKFSSFINHSCIYALLAILLNNYIHANNSQRERMHYTRSLSYVYDMINFINNNIYKELSISQIASSIHLSESHASRVFKKITGSNLGKYLESIRLSTAEQLLRNSNYSISQIASICGFNDHSYFTLRFRKKYNLSPKSYRKTHY